MAAVLKEAFSKEDLKDPYWRLNHLYTIRDKEGRRIQFKMNAAQEWLYRNMWYLTVILKARQHGFTTLVCLYALDACLFNKDVKAGIIAHHIDDANEIYSDKIKFPYDNLHPYIRERVTSRTDRVGEKKFSNGSQIRVSTSFRSGTLQILLVSEFGKIAARYPEKAREIRTGAFEAVAQGQQIFVESTAEGKEGDFYEICERARKLYEQGKKLVPLDFKFTFFAWHENPEYASDTEGVVLTQELLKYFEEMESRGIKLSNRQKAWYAKKLLVLGDDMKREYPSYPEEAFEASVKGAYYQVEMTKMRREGRICQVPYDTNFPVDTFWDLGMRNKMAIWFFQMVGTQRRLFDYYENSGEGLDHYAKVLHEKSYVYGKHYMPHDISVRELGQTAGKTREEKAMSLGIRPIIRSPRPRNEREFAEHIEMTRTFLSGSWIDEAHCDVGIKSLDNYRMAWDPNTGTFKGYPAESQVNNCADALRTGAVKYQAHQYVSQQDLLPEAFAD